MSYSCVTKRIGREPRSDGDGMRVNYVCNKLK